MVDPLGQASVLMHSGIGRCAVYGTGAKGVGHIENKFVHSDTAARLQPKKLSVPPAPGSGS